jgi:hypothetical protein
MEYIFIINVRHLSYSTIIIFLILLFKNIKKLLLKMKFKILNIVISEKIKEQLKKKKILILLHVLNPIQYTI